MRRFDEYVWSIQAAAARMVEIANESGETVGMEFNGIEITAEPGQDPESIVKNYGAEWADRSRAYQTSPEGQEAARRRDENARIAAAAAAEGIRPFAVTNQEEWDRTVSVNSDPYGACAIRYAARWANLMEAQLSTASSVGDVADQCSDAANLEGITGFMYGCAVGILSRVWIHGEELRRWHNLKTQIGDEGERANESGGALNPALLRVG